MHIFAAALAMEAKAKRRRSSIDGRYLAKTWIPKAQLATLLKELAADGIQPRFMGLILVPLVRLCVVLVSRYWSLGCQLWLLQLYLWAIRN